MENRKEINLKDINENIYFLENQRIQIYINGIYINIYDKKYEEYDYNTFINKIFSRISINKKLQNIIYRNVEEEIDEKEDYLIYNTNEISYINGIKDEILNISLTNYLLNTITYYIFNFKQEKINEYIDILKDNIISSNIIKKKITENKKIEIIDWIKKIYLNKKIFEDIYKLNLDVKIIFYNLNSLYKIINYDIKQNGNKKYLYYKLNNNDEIYRKNYYSNHNNSICYFNETQNNYYNLIYNEILIINCSNNDDNKEIENNLINKLKKEIEDLKKENNNLLEENKKLNDNIIDLNNKLNITFINKENINDEYNEKNKKQRNLIKEIEDLKKEYNILLDENNILLEENNKLLEENKELNDELHNKLDITIINKENINKKNIKKDNIDDKKIKKQLPKNKIQPSKCTKMLIDEEEDISSDSEKEL